MTSRQLWQSWPATCDCTNCFRSAYDTSSEVTSESAWRDASMRMQPHTVTALATARWTRADASCIFERTSSTLRCRSEEHTSELQSRPHLVCRLLLEKKKSVREGSRLGGLVDSVL